MSTFTGAIGSVLATPIIKSSVLRDGLVVTTGDTIYVGTRPLTLAEEVARDCAYIVRRGFKPWLDRWGEKVENQPSSADIFNSLARRGAAPRPPLRVRQSRVARDD